MENKDFLEQFSSNNKPDSFKEEEFVPTTKGKKHISPVLIIVLVVILLLAGFLYWFFALRPTIEVPSFIGQKMSDVNSWVKQQGIQASGIVFKEEYSEDYDSKLIISQSIEEGTKVRKDVKLDFTISLGADPNVSVIVPDIASMTLADINSWISNNKLTGVKLSYEFSDEDPLDSVIAFEFANGASETNFKRSSIVNIIVSKGNQADQPISVPNFNNKNYSDVTAWGSKNKIKIVKKEEYSSTVNKDMVIDQSVNPGKKITSKESLVVTISKGAPIIAPDFSSYSEENILAWGSKNGVNIEIIKKYSSNVDKNKVIEQSIVDKPCNDGMSVTISLGNINVSSLIGSTLDEYNRWKEEANTFGADISEHIVEVNDDNIDPNIIISINNVGVGKTLEIKLSKGKNIYLNSIVEEGVPISWDTLRDHPETYNEDQVRKLCESENNKGISYNFVYRTSDTVAQRNVIEVTRSDGKKRNDDKVDIGDNMYISQSVTLVFTICENYTGS